MRTIDKNEVAAALREAIPQLAFDLPADIEAGIQKAARLERDERAAEVLRLLCENACVAHADRVPICQDTGSVWVCLEAGPDILVPGDVFGLVDDAIAEAYIGSRLRKSIVKDAIFDRANTNDNTPAFTEVHFVEQPGVRLKVMLKGGGSDNASRVVMLTPGAGKQGIIDALLDCVRAKAANACPPLIIGIGIGATFDKVAGLAKQALMRPIDEQNPNPRAAALEEELLQLVNATGIGAGALGGATTALAVHVKTAPCHIAALPLAINMGCSAMRRGTYEL